MVFFSPSKDYFVQCNFFQTLKPSQINSDNLKRFIWIIPAHKRLRFCMIIQCSRYRLPETIISLILIICTIVRESAAGGARSELECQLSVGGMKN